MKSFAFIIILFWFAIALSWCVNVYKLVNCDFEPSWKGEIIHVVGVFIPPASLVTVWTNFK